MQLQEAKRLAGIYDCHLSFNGDGTLTLKSPSGEIEELYEAQIAEMKKEDFIDFYLEAAQYPTIER